MSDELFGQNVSRETYDKLRAYEALIQKWNPSAKQQKLAAYIAPPVVIFLFFCGSGG